MDDRDGLLRFYFILLLVAIVPLFVLGLSNHGVWTADEPRVAEIGREMALTGNWGVPTLDRKPFLEEPPLFYAAIAVVFKTFGVASDKIVRIPSAVFAFGGVLALFFLGNMLLGPRVGSSPPLSWRRAASTFVWPTGSSWTAPWHVSSCSPSRAS